MRMTRLAFLLLLAACAAGNLYGINAGPTQFPIIGGGLGQTLRVIAVAPEGGAGCDAMLGFVDVAGNPAPPNPNKTVMLAAGQSDFLDFPANLILTARGERLELRPTADVMAMLPSGAPASTDCMFFAEVFDQFSGFSQVYKDPGPVTINPGQGTFLDFSPGGMATPVDVSAAGMAMRVGQRVEVRPVAMISSPNPTMPCMGVVFLGEIFDTFTGHTWAAKDPGPQQ